MVGKEPTKQDRIVIVGHGMVATRFCESLVENSANETQFQLTLLGQEPRLAYNRVKLSQYFDHQDEGRLRLRSAQWYEDHHIDVLTGVTATSLDLDDHVVLTEDGQRVSYDHLVLATGSRPFVPPISGGDHPSVFVYRTIPDLERIIERSRTAKSAVVIGGGLLGLEAAHGLRQLGIQEVHIVELSNFLLSRQLNEAAASILAHEIIDKGYELHLGRRTESIRDADGGGCVVTLDNQVSLPVDMVVISAGIVPNSELARQAGLPCAQRGGVVVSDKLVSDHPSVYAIGECAHVHGSAWGLVSPGYEMAEILAHNLLSPRKPKTFEKPDLSTRLKMIGVEVTMIGDYLQPGVSWEQSSEDSYRLVSFDSKGRISGSLSVAPWEETAFVPGWIKEGRRFYQKDRKRFEATGQLSTKSAPSIESWSDQAMVCNCLSITKGTLCAAIAGGCDTTQALARETGASSVCGSCKPLLHALTGTLANTEPPEKTFWLLRLSVLAAVLIVLVVAFPTLPVADSAESMWHRLSGIWRDAFFKKASGFTLLGISLAGLVLSFRKRIPKFTFGHFRHWRLLHIGFGITALVALFAHTGFQFGHNLNFWLMLVFVLLNLLGGATGIVSALESNPSAPFSALARKWRKPLIWSHIVLFWPLPVLIVFHILSAYLY
ncbi:MAG: FAD-dependent oxidoreductase [Verrucomicrobiota bacterium]